MKLRGEGPIPTRIMLVEELPSAEDERLGVAFSGASGQELNRLLHEAGIMVSECYKTSVLRIRPPEGQLGNYMALKKKDISTVHKYFRGRYVTKEIVDGYTELCAEIELVQPNLIVAFGNLAMWALTGEWGILKWRGSQLTTDGAYKCNVIPTLHPQGIFMQWELRALVLNDLRRAKRHMVARHYTNKPSWNFIIRPTFAQVMEVLTMLQARAEAGELWLDFDIETRGGSGLRGYTAAFIDCIGISWSRTEAICVPFMTTTNLEGYWSADEEAHIVFALYKLLTHSNTRNRWQNGLYDAQYVYRRWHFLPNTNGQDTMISHHSVFAALNKSLSFIAALYADWYVYWKDEGKVATGEAEDKRWVYNLQDCVYTRECGEVLVESVKALGLTEVEATQQALFTPVLKAMLRGVRMSAERRAEMAMQIEEELSHREAFFYNVLGHTINVSSPKQMQTLFYEDLRQPIVYNRKKVNGRTIMSPSCDDEALSKIAAREPLLKPICNAIADIRTLNKFLGDFVMMPLDEDERMRCSFNIAGDAGGKSAPYSYRLSSSKNPFGSGGNLQTIPSEKSKSSGKAAARGSMDFTLPNIRSMYVPDPGYTFFDMDLDRADLQVVVWESDDQMLKAAMRLGVDIHLLNVFALDKQDPPPLEELVETHPKYWDYRGPRKHKREFAKVFCHATNYVGGAKTVAAHTGRGVHEIDTAQKYWFSVHPGIKAWHVRVETQITKFRFVQNAFGYRWYIFDRLDALLPEAVAWIPQSTVGIVINKAWIAFDQGIPELQVLLQVHDSLAGQFPTHRREFVLPRMQSLSRITVPYDDPLIIPTGIKTSTVSWGDCE